MWLVELQTDTVLSFRIDLFRPFSCCCAFFRKFFFFNICQNGVAWATDMRMERETTSITILAGCCRSLVGRNWAHTVFPRMEMQSCYSDELVLYIVLRYVRRQSNSEEKKWKRNLRAHMCRAPIPVQRHTHIHAPKLNLFAPSETISNAQKEGKKRENI